MGEVNMRIKCKFHSGFNIASFFLLFLAFAVFAYLIYRDAYSPFWGAIGIIMIAVLFGLYLFAFLFLFKVLDYIIFYSDRIEVCPVFRKKRIAVYEDYAVVVGRYESIIERRKAFIFTPKKLNAVCDYVDTRRFGNLINLNKKSVLYCIYNEKLNNLLMNKFAKFQEQITQVVAVTPSKQSSKQTKSIEELHEDILNSPNSFLLKDIEYPSDYPVFKFFPNPLRTQSVIESPIPCECCGKSSKYSYVGGMLSKGEEIENLCLECIASGAAATKFDGEFTDYKAIANRTADKAITEEIMLRTPGMITFQEPVWLSHCKTPCMYIGQVYVGDLLKMCIYKQVRTELLKDYYYKQMPMTIAEIDMMLIHMIEGSSLSGHLFQCTQCRKYKLHTELD